MYLRGLSHSLASTFALCAAMTAPRPHATFLPVDVYQDSGECFHDNFEVMGSRKELGNGSRKCGDVSNQWLVNNLVLAHDKRLRNRHPRTKACIIGWTNLYRFNYLNFNHVLVQGGI
jgi:hypothetical protein